MCYIVFFESILKRFVKYESLNIAYGIFPRFYFIKLIFNIWKL